MKNFIKLLQTIENHTDDETLAFIIMDHYADIRNAAQNIYNNNTTRKNAVKGYGIPERLKDIQDHDNGLYCDGCTAVSLAMTRPQYDENNTIYKMFKEQFQKKRRPVSLRDSFDYSIAAARCNGWRQGDTDHIIRIEGHIYNLSLVAKVYKCIADNKEVNGCRIEITDDRHPIMILSSRYGVGVVLPICSERPGLYDVTPGDSDLDKIMDRLTERAKKTA